MQGLLWCTQGQAGSPEWAQCQPSCGQEGWKGWAPAGLHGGCTGASGSLPPLLPLQLPCARNVLELIEFFEEEDRFYLVFEKMRGGMWGLGDTPPGSSWAVGWATRKDFSELPLYLRMGVGCLSFLSRL